MKRLAPILALAIPLYAWNLRSPFLHHVESNPAQVGKQARNFNKFGFGATRGVLLDLSGPALTPDYRRYFYPDHPMLLQWIQAGVFAVFGVHESSIRGVSVLFALGCVSIFYFLSARSIVATAFFAFAPMFAYMSIATSHQVPTLFFILCALLFYRRWGDASRPRDLGLLFAFQLLACYTDWPGYYLALVVAAHQFAQRKWKLGAAVIGFNFLIFGLYLLQLHLADPAGDAPLKHIGFVFRSRSSGAPLGAYLVSQAREIGLYITVIQVALAAFAIARLRSALGWILALPLLGADFVLFRNICFGHDYYMYYLSPFFALAAARGVEALRSLIERRALKCAATAMIVAAFIGQAGFVMARRLTQTGAYEFYYRMALGIDRTVKPEERIALFPDDLPFYTRFYADRRCYGYDRGLGQAMFEYAAGTEAMDLATFLERIRSEKFEWAVLAEKDGVMSSVGYFRRIRPSDEILATFGVEVGPSPVRDWLEIHASRKLTEEGFTFYRLTP